MTSTLALVAAFCATTPVPCETIALEAVATGKPALEYQWTVDELQPRARLSSPLTSSWSFDSTVTWPDLEPGPYRVTSRARNRYGFDMVQFDLEILGGGQCSVGPLVKLMIFSDGFETGTTGRWSRSVQ